MTAPPRTICEERADLGGKKRSLSQSDGETGGRDTGAAIANQRRLSLGRGGEYKKKRGRGPSMGGHSKPTKKKSVFHRTGGKKTRGCGGGE